MEFLNENRTIPSFYGLQSHPYISLKDRKLFNFPMWVLSTIQPLNRSGLNVHCLLPEIGFFFCCCLKHNFSYRKKGEKNPAFAEKVDEKPPHDVIYT